MQVEKDDSLMHIAPISVFVIWSSNRIQPMSAEAYGGSEGSHVAIPSLHFIKNEVLKKRYMQCFSLFQVIEMDRSLTVIYFN